MHLNIYICKGPFGKLLDCVISEVNSSLHRKEAYHGPRKALLAGGGRNVGRWQRSEAICVSDNIATNGNTAISTNDTGL